MRWRVRHTSYTTLKDFEYFEPSTLAEALSITTKDADNCKILAGGTDLMVLMMRRKITPTRVVNISRISSLNFINYDEKRGLRLGALASLRSIERSAAIRKNFPLLFDATRVLGSVQIRNMATIGGNLCNASPAADTAPPLLALDAHVVIASQHNRREIPLESFFLGPGKTGLLPGEILTEIDVETVPFDTKTGFVKLGRTPTDISKASAGVLLQSQAGICQQVRIALGAVAPTPIRARKAVELLKNKKICHELIEEVAKQASDEAKPIDDIRSTARWRKEAIKYLVKSLLRRMWEMAPF